ncbi:MAG TPA: beta-galactosidase, partial [Anaerolineae bacterium]
QTAVAPITAYAGPDHLQSFEQAGVGLFTFNIPGMWWIGPDQYDFSGLSSYIEHYILRLGTGLFMPRIDLSGQGFPWWGQAHPDEMNVLRAITTGEVLDQTAPNPKAVPYLGHEVQLDRLNLHSFHSQVWRADAGRAVAALIAHCEAQPYAERIWGWHLCDGLFCEWFHWNEYSFDGMADYSPAAQVDFRRWLRQTYHNDPHLLSQAWGRPADFESAEIPLPGQRNQPAHAEFYDPVRDRPTIDYTQCFSEATVDSIIAVCEAAKHALPRPKVTCVFYGYQFSNMPRPQLNAHYAAKRLLDSAAVDMIASPHAYSNRGEGGYHSPQAIADSIRRAGKLHFDEIDCKTAWTPASVTWKRHISQPATPAATIEMMKKDAAYQLASATAQWWMDLTDQGWFDAPELVDPIRRLRNIELRLQGMDRVSFGEIAFVVSQRAMMFQAPREGLHNVTLKMFRNWHLSRMGAPFEQLLIDDLARPDLPAYKLYIMANAFYLSRQQRDLLERVIKRNHATVLWIYAPGYLDDQSAALECMQQITGLRFGMAALHSEHNVRLTNFDHPLTHGLPAGFAFGTGIDREQYLRPPRMQYLPDTASAPVFYVDDPHAEVLGLEQATGQPGLAMRQFEDWRSIYSAAPLLPWPLMRNIARLAGVHIYDDDGDMLWANNTFLAINAQHAGRHTLRLPRPMRVEDAYTGDHLGDAITTLDVQMGLWETKLLYTL